VIYVLEHGRPVEFGDWPTLAAAGGRFAAMCAAQGVPLGHHRDLAVETRA
jgi:ABC-type multidrug transport system fused ATPase/permease subunit